MPDLLEILKILVPLIIGGYLVHRYQLIQGKVKLKQDRFIANFAKLEEFLSIVKDAEFIQYRYYENKAKYRQLLESRKKRREALNSLNEKLIKLNIDIDELNKRITNVNELRQRIEKSVQERNGNIEHLSTIVLEDLIKIIDDLVSDVHKYKNEFNESENQFIQLEKEMKDCDDEVSITDASVFKLIEEAEEITLKVIKSDIDAVVLIIDPTGNLGNIINEIILTLQIDPDKSPEEISAINQKRTKLKVEIERLRSEKINKI